MSPYGDECVSHMGHTCVNERMCGHECASVRGYALLVGLASF